MARTLVEHVPSGFFVLRTPLLPLACFTALDRSKLRDLAVRPEVREALFVSSPNLEERLGVWLQDPTSEAGRKVELPLVRYLSRMAVRPTPFGLTAGCSVGRLGERTSLRLAALERSAAHTRLDVECLDRILREVCAREDVLDRLTVRANTSLHRLPQGALRFAEVRLEAGGRRYLGISVEPTPYLDAVLERAARPARIDELVDLLVAHDPEIGREEASAYVRELVTAQILVPTLAVPLTGPEPLATVCAELRALGVIDVATRLEEAGARLEAMDAKGVGRSPSAYREIATGLGDLAGDIGRLFQVELVKAVDEAVLGPDAIGPIREAVDLLRQVAAPRDVLAAFKTRFYARYETREVPLLEALDDEAGIGSLELSGVAVPLLEGLDVGAAAKEPRTWTDRDDTLLAILTGALHRGEREVVLDDASLAALAPAGGPRDLGDAFAIMGSLFRDEDGALGFAATMITGVSGAQLLARFCHADPALEAGVRAHLAREEALRPDAIFAEIVHFPEGHSGNVILRPLLRDHEIPYLGRSGARAEHRIDAADLRLSLRAGRLVLRSARLDREVVPRLSSAHNYLGQGTGAYQLLAALGRQDGSHGAWSWGALEKSCFVPRVRRGRVVLAPACWRLTREQIATLNGSAGEAETMRRVGVLREELRLPRHVGLADDDRVLPVDLDNVLTVDVLRASLRTRSEALLVEMFPRPDALVVAGDGGEHAHEIVVPFVRQAPREGAEVAARPRGGAPIERRFPPGSEWLWASFYTGTATADEVLRREIGPFVRAAGEAGLIDRWFFVRYGAPDHHLRLRVHGDPSVLTRQVWPILADVGTRLAREGLVWRSQLDTYEREVERYGGPASMLLIEDLFAADSVAALAIVEAFDDDGGVEERWKLALLGFDATLDDLGFDLPGKHRAVDVAPWLWDDPYRATPTLARQIGERYRVMKPEIEALLTGDPGTLAPLQAGLDALAARRERSLASARELRARSDAGALERPIEHVVGALLHMNANRLLREAQTYQELLLYGWLRRHYESRLARARRQM